MGQTGTAIPGWLNVSRETFERLTAMVALVEKWNPAINLISKASIAQIWQRHVYDSAQLFMLAPHRIGRWIDLGSGAGFPGLVVSIIAREEAPHLQVALVEADQRKSTFLSEVVRQLDLSATVIALRIESLPPQNADILSARALAPLSDLCGHAQRHLAKTGLALFPKGAQAADEIEQARKTWRFDVALHPSKTDDFASILAVKDVVHV